MAAVDHDYYALLGVPRDAGDDAIKKAFRTLAREHHPDVSDAPDADDRFKELVEAYEVLSNPERARSMTASAMKGCAIAGSCRASISATSRDLFAAFFGDDCSPRAAGGVAAVARTSAPR